MQELEILLQQRAIIQDGLKAYRDGGWYWKEVLRDIEKQIDRKTGGLIYSVEWQKA